MESQELDSATTGGDRILEIVEEFALRVRSGEQPNIESYVQSYPEIADQLRSYLPTIGVLEDVAECETHHGSKDGTHSRSDCQNADRAELPSDSPFGRYHILRSIGRGAMGTVYLARDTRLGRTIALKVARIDPGDHVAIERFQREARAIATVSHSKPQVQICLPVATYTHSQGCRTMSDTAAPGRDQPFTSNTPATARVPVQYG